MTSYYTKCLKCGWIHEGHPKRCMRCDHKKLKRCSPTGELNHDC